ncbi:MULTISPECIES: DUF6153 family protein [Arthrobacter]|uniref:DUF6153 family protein n=1 Tax=unclassified Arthrobacter TaxID=235627 RepID=UPI0024BB0FE7|nr:DUF6153 family protein [Arthrobacter sp. H35-MC1]MDJ0315594.1 DUF6153 family protein [Arthrobacter sp. H35-MC1]
MTSSATLPLPGSLLRLGGALTLILLLVAGILGMHMIAGAQASPMATAHAGTSATMSIADHGEVPNTSNHLGDATVCGCSPLGCEMPMAGHGSCIPAPGTGTPTAPQPGLVPDPSAGPTASDQAGYKISGRLLDPPSLTQLSISRT